MACAQLPKAQPSNQSAVITVVGEVPCALPCPGFTRDGWNRARIRGAGAQSVLPYRPEHPSSFDWTCNRTVAARPYNGLRPNTSSGDVSPAILADGGKDRVEHALRGEAVRERGRRLCLSRNFRDEISDQR